jgi:hypothetical protein
MILGTFSQDIYNQPDGTLSVDCSAVADADGPLGRLARPEGLTRARPRLQSARGAARDERRKRRPVRRGPRRRLPPRAARRRRSESSRSRNAASPSHHPARASPRFRRGARSSRSPRSSPPLRAKAHRSFRSAALSPVEPRTSSQRTEARPARSLRAARSAPPQSARAARTPGHRFRWAALSELQRCALELRKPAAKCARAALSAGHNPSDLELAALALLLDDLRDAA